MDNSDEQTDLISRTDPALLDLLRVLVRALEPDQNDVVEFNFDSSGNTGALVYPRARRSTTSFQKLFSTLDLPSPLISVFWSLLSRIPAERHAVRLVTTGAVSVFFSVDLPASGIAAIGEAIGLHGYDSVSAFFQDIKRPACAIALEMSPGGSARLRFYHMVRSMKEVRRVIDVAGLHLALDQPRRDELEAACDRLLRPGDEVVINVGTDSRSGGTIKFEFPGIDSGLPPTIFRLDGAEREAWLAARLLAQRIGRKTFPYVGIRCSSAGRRGFTFYVDVRPLVTCIGEEAVE